jgi:EAL domain-containing protein (putative c-di-GMP-specific phosphodiesterase class I)
MLTSIVQISHQSGYLVVIEGIETEEQALIATDSNANFAQGFIFLNINLLALFKLK